MIDVPAVNGRDDAMGIDIQIYTPVVEMAFGKRLEVAVSQHAFALVGLVVGAITPWVVQQTTDIQFYLYAAIGIVSCVVTGYVASLVLPGDDHDLTGLTVYSMDETRQVAR